MPNDRADVIKRWSTTDVPQAKRLDYFAAALSEAVIPFAVNQADPLTFRAQISCAQLDAIRVCKTIGSRHRSFRGRGELARTGEDSFHLLMTLQTSWTANHRGPMNCPAASPTRFRRAGRTDRTHQILRRMQMCRTATGEAIARCV